MTRPPNASPSPRLCWALVAISAVAFLSLAWWLIPWSWLPEGKLVSVAPRDEFSAAALQRIHDYSAPARWIGLTSTAVSLAVGLTVALTPLGRSWWRLLRGPWPARVAESVVVVLTIGALCTAPLRWWAHRRARSVGLSVQDAGAWWRDWAVSLAVDAALTSIALVVVIGLIRRCPRTWPVWVSAAAVTLAFGGTFLYPVAVEPLFNKFTPMGPTGLRSQVMTMAEQMDVPVKEVLVADASRRTTALNAYVSGIGSTRRVVVYDTALKGLPPDQIKVIVAHELGHARDNDMLVGTTLAAVGLVSGIGLLGVVLRRRTLAVAGLERPGDPRVVALLLALMSLAGLAVSPLQSTMSRAVEARADRTSLTVTQDNEAFIALQRALATKALSDPQPPALVHWWFGSHPTTMQRIGLALSLQRQADREDRD